MSEIITQTPMSLPVIAGAYRWLLAQTEGQDADCTYDVYAFSCVDNCEVSQQYELFPLYASEQARFQELVRRWRSERGSKSSTTEIVLCESYQAIIAMGTGAIPLILAQMESEEQHPDQWFWALQILTGANPVSEVDEGNFPRMAQSWLQWARWRYVW